MSSKNRIGQIIKIEATSFTLISLPMGLALILAAFYHSLALTARTANSIPPPGLTNDVVAFGIVNQCSQVNVHAR